MEHNIAVTVHSCTIYVPTQIQEATPMASLFLSGDLEWEVGRNDHSFAIVIGLGAVTDMMSTS